MTVKRIAHRAEAAIAAVLPRSVRVLSGREKDHVVDLDLNGQTIEVKWLGEGGLRQTRELIRSQRNRPDVVAARRISPGAREALAAAGIGWVDETGAAEIVFGTLIISTSGRSSPVVKKPPHWTPAVLAVAEALLCGGRPTVGGMQEISGLSAGACTNALRTLTDLGLLSATARRGRYSARSISDPDLLLDNYATAAAAMMSPVALTVGATWPDFVIGMREIGRQWDHERVRWAATGTVAASVIAPYLTRVATGEVYVDRMTIAGLEWVASIAGLRIVEGGRLTLRPFPTVTAKSLALVRDDLCVAPWPRVYSDLRVVGVRGEEAAEHLRELIRDR